jgi:hypothetical protein
MTDPGSSIGCGAFGGGSTVSIAPLVHEGIDVPNARVNGIAYESELTRCLSRACASLIAKVPALDVSISFSTPDANAILRTLTYSTYARVLRQPFGATPSTWKTVSFDGVALDVPPSWRVASLTNTPFCSPAPNTAYYGRQRILPDCTFVLGIPTPVDSLQISPGSDPSDGTTLTRHGLRLERAPVSGPLDRTLTFTVHGGHEDVTVTVGLGRDAAIARGILGSIRLAS